MESENYDDLLKEVCNMASNIYDVAILRSNMILLALFILIWEMFKKMIIKHPKHLFCGPDIDHTHVSKNYPENETYKKEVRSLNKNDIFNASLSWLLKQNAITSDDIAKISEIRHRRNELVHEIVESIFKGIKDEDITLLADLLKLYFKIDTWWEKHHLDKKDTNINEEIVGKEALLLYTVTCFATGHGKIFEEAKNLFDQLKDRIFQKNQRNNTH